MFSILRKVSKLLVVPISLLFSQPTLISRLQLIAQLEYQSDRGGGKRKILEKIAGSLEVTSWHMPKCGRNTTVPHSPSPSPLRTHSSPQTALGCCQSMLHFSFQKWKAPGGKPEKRVLIWKTSKTKCRVGLGKSVAKWAGQVHIIEMVKKKIYLYLK